MRNPLRRYYGRAHLPLLLLAAIVASCSWRILALVAFLCKYSMKFVSRHKFKRSAM